MFSFFYDCARSCPHIAVIFIFVSLLFIGAIIELILELFKLIIQNKKTMAKYTKLPRITSSKKECLCDETGSTILKGMDCLVDPVNKKVYSQVSKKYKSLVGKSK